MTIRKTFLYVFAIAIVVGVAGTFATWGGSMLHVWGNANANNNAHHHAPAPNWPGSKGWVALTLDDGPSPNTSNSGTPRVLRVMRDEKVPATFFLIGEKAKAHPKIVADIRRIGGTIGNHSWDHAHLTKLSNAQVKAEFAKTNAILKKEGVKPKFYRAPYLELNANVRNDATALGMHQVGVPRVSDSKDYEHPGNVKAACDRAVNGASNGSVILVHDDLPNSPQTIKCIIKGVRAKGLQFGRLAPSRYNAYNQSNATVAIVK